MRRILFSIFMICCCLPLLFGEQEKQPEKNVSVVSGGEKSSRRKSPAAGRPCHAHIMEVLDRMKKNRPEEYRRLQQLRISDRQEFFRQMRILSSADGRHRFYARFKNLEKEQKTLAEQYTAAESPEEKEQLLQLLRKKIEEHHDLILEDLKNRISKMQKKIVQMEKRSEEIREQKLQRLLKKYSSGKK